MESSRTQINLVAGGFTNLYTAASITVGMKLGLQNLSSDPIIITLGTSGSVNKGYILNPLESTVIPAGVTGCFVQTVTGEAGIVAIDIGGYNIHGISIDERVYTGLKALCTQSFSESNSKNGTQWEFTLRDNAVASNGNLDLLFTTGNQYVIIKSLQITFTGSEIEGALYKNTVASAGTIISSYNMNTEIGGSPLAVVKQQPTVTSVGTIVGAPLYSYGTQDQGNRTFASFSTPGAERILPPNTAFLRRITNKGGVACKISVQASFYEGEISSLNG